MERKSFVIYADTKNLVEKLNNEQAGILFKAIFAFVSQTEIPEMDGITEMAFSIISNYLERDIAKYEKRCERNRQNINKRWNANNTNAYERIQSNTNAYERNFSYYDNDSDNDSDNKNDNDSDIVNNLVGNEAVTQDTLHTTLFLSDHAYCISKYQFGILCKTFPDLSIAEQLNKIANWCGNTKPNLWNEEAVWTFIIRWLTQEKEKLNTGSSTKKKNGFNDFEKNDYNFDELEKMLLADKKEK